MEAEAIGVLLRKGTAGIGGRIAVGLRPDTPILGAEGLAQRRMKREAVQREAAPILKRLEGLRPRIGGIRRWRVRNVSYSAAKTSA